MNIAIKKITYLSSPFDIPSIEFLSNIVPLFKIPSGEITNLPYLRKIASYGKKVILSSGMSTLDDINMALEVLTTNGLKISQITVLHCTSNYPCEISDVNLKSMKTIKSTFGVNVGYSDHTLGLEIPIAAVALGATVIEKHFTIDKNLSGPDHKASLEPNELADMVSSIRKIEYAIGDGIKAPTTSEIVNIKVVRKSIVAKTTIKCGEVFTEKILFAKDQVSELVQCVGIQCLEKQQKDFGIDELIYYED